MQFLEDGEDMAFIKVLLHEDSVCMSCRVLDHDTQCIYFYYSCAIIIHNARNLDVGPLLCNPGVRAFFWPG